MYSGDRPKTEFLYAKIVIDGRMIEVQGTPDLYYSKTRINSLSDDLVILTDSDVNPKSFGTSHYSDDYKSKVFQLWYNNGKPPGSDLINILPIPETNYGKKPSVQALNLWIREFKERAEELDQQVREELDHTLISAKVEMLKRHVDVAREMQRISLEFLREAELTPAAAVRLLADGIAIERNSLGIPEALMKMVEMSDEQLVAEIKKELERSPIERTEQLDE